MPLISRGYLLEQVDEDNHGKPVHWCSSGTVAKTEMVLYRNDDEHRS